MHTKTRHYLMTDLDTHMTQAFFIPISYRRTSEAYKFTYWPARHSWKSDLNSIPPAPELMLTATVPLWIGLSVSVCANPSMSFSMQQAVNNAERNQATLLGSYFPLPASSYPTFISAFCSPNFFPALS